MQPSLANPGHAPARRSPAPRHDDETSLPPGTLDSPTTIVSLQRLVGNEAVARMFRDAATGPDAPSIQRWTNPVLTLKDDPQLIEDGLKGDIEAIKHISHYDTAIDSAKIGLIRILLDNGGVWGRNASALEGLWGAYGSRLPTAAGQNIDLWKRSVEADKDLRNLPAVKDVPDKFIGDVVATARGYLNDNEKTVNKEVADLGGNERDEVGGEADANVRSKVADLQEGAKRLTHAREGMQALELLQIGTEITGEGGVDETEPITFKDAFLEGGPPGPQTNGGKKTYDVPLFNEIMAKYALAQAAVNGLLAKYPALVGLESGGGDAGAAANLATDNPEAARGAVLAALHRVREHIADTREKLTDDLPYELTPIHDQLLQGKVKTGTDWTNPFNKSIAEATVGAYKDRQFWIELGLSTLAAAAFIVAEIATGGAATFFVGFAVGIGIGQASEKWQKAKALSDASQASLDPNAQLVASGQAEAAGIDALLATVFAFIDLKMGAGILAKVGKLAELAKIGEMTIENARPLVEKSIAEYGVEATSRQTGKTPAELLELVGNDSPAASRLKMAMEAPRVPEALEKQTELGLTAKKAAKTRGMGLLWTLMTREQRAAKLLEIVNERLSAGGIPTIKGFKWSGGPGAFFDFRDWKFALNEASLKAWVHTDEDFAKLIETAYHEARHSEQWFQMARYKAGSMFSWETSADIATQMGIPQDIADAAAKVPLKFGTPEYTEASNLYISIYGTVGKAAREKVLADLKTWTAKLAADRATVAQLKKAGAAAGSIQSAEAQLAATEASYNAAYKAYQNLPEEADAWKVGQDAADAYRKEAGL